MEHARIKNSVALVTGAAHGIGASVDRRLAELGARVVVADVDVGAGEALAQEIDGHFVRCDVSELADNQSAVATAVRSYGSLSIVALNAGISTGLGIGAGFDAAAYRRAMAINLDGVVFGAAAALPVLAAGGGGDIIVTASIAGLLPTSIDPIYGAGKSAVVGLVRALGPVQARQGVRVNGLCPGFADTAIIDDIRDVLADDDIAILDMQTITETFIAILISGRAGECWPVLPGIPSRPFEFAEVPGLDSVYPTSAWVRWPR
jgi:NAD(P)-dependent dehydrogenase (short-subunit alcohol dehydrogenase family)